MKEWGLHLPRGNPVDAVTIPTQPKGRKRRLNKSEATKLNKHAKAYGGEIAAIITLALETGMRRGEISRLRWCDIDLRKCTAQLYDTKNAEDREIPLSTVAISVVKKQKRIEDATVFALQPDSITQAFERVCHAADIENLRFHDLRHEATTRFFEKGFNIMEVSSITGHKDIAMLRSYTHLRAEDLATRLT